MQVFTRFMIAILLFTSFKPACLAQAEDWHRVIIDSNMSFLMPPGMIRSDTVYTNELGRKVKQKQFILDNDSGNIFYTITPFVNEDEFNIRVDPEETYSEFRSSLRQEARAMGLDCTFNDTSIDGKFAMKMIAYAGSDSLYTRYAVVQNNVCYNLLFMEHRPGYSETKIRFLNGLHFRGEQYLTDDPRDVTYHPGTAEPPSLPIIREVKSFNSAWIAFFIVVIIVGLLFFFTRR